MRARVNTVLAALCVALAITVTVQAISPFHRDQNNETAQSAADHGQNQQSYLAAFWKWTTHDPVAFYTSVLALFTGVLGASTIGLWIQTGKAADAARVAAEHVPKVERPYLFVILQEENISQFVAGIEANRKGSDREELFVRCSFRNYGKTPAFLRKIDDNLMLCTDGLPPEPVFGFNDYRLRENVIASGDRIGPLCCERTIKITDEQASRMAWGLLEVSFHGRVVYDDAFGERHEHYFRFFGNGGNEGIVAGREPAYTKNT